MSNASDDDILPPSPPRFQAPAEILASGAPISGRLANLLTRPRYVYVPPFAPSATDLREMARSRIPVRFQWARWDAPELPARVAGGARMIGLVRDALASDSRVVLVGPAGAGKTALVCAWLWERILGGAHRAAFVPDRLLLEQSHRDANPVAWFHVALGAAPLVLDNFGTLYGAPANSGLAGQRIATVCRLLADRHDRDMGHVITTDRGRVAVAGAYGDDVARRVFESATVVMVGSGKTTGT